MRRLLSLSALVAIFAISCQQELNNDVVVDNNTTTITNLSPYRSYDEALQIAEESIAIIEGKGTTRANAQRRIAKDKGQVIRTETTRSGGGGEPVAYVFNFEEEQGFAVIAADERFDPVIAVTEQGSYTYGEPTGVEAFDEYMDNTIDLMSIIFPPTIDPGDPITPTPGTYFEEVDIYNRVDPLLTTVWGQTGIHAAYYPGGTVACAAVAVGQIMAYHKKPTTIRLTYSNNSNITIDWDGILEHTYSNDHWYSRYEDVCHCGCNYDALGELLYEIGYRLYVYDCQINPAGNNVWDGRAYMGSIQLLLQNIGYDSATLDVYDSEYNSDKYTIFNNLDDDCPVLVYGVDLLANSTAGHVWIADGYHEEASGRNYYVSNPEYNWLNPTPGVPQYIFSHSTVVRTEMLHFNWGYNGDCNGWFNYGIYDMGNEVSYDNSGYIYDNTGTYNFSTNMGFIYDIVY